MKIVNIFALIMLVATVSFLGFIVENVWLALTKGYIDNRNMCFPFLLGYGLAILLIYVILGTPKKIWLFGKMFFIKNKIIKFLVYFIGVMICVSIGEIVLGTFVEKVCNFYWWDYSSLPLHITRYTSIPTSTMFSALIYFFMDNIFQPLYFFFQDWSFDNLKRYALILGLIISVDFVYNSYKMYKTQAMTKRWQVTIHSKHAHLLRMP